VLEISNLLDYRANNRLIHGNTTTSSLYKREVGTLFNPELANPTPNGMVPCSFEGGHDG
jgi:hypothetical protein